MNTNSMQGEWELRQYHHLIDEIPYGDEDNSPRLDEIQAWLMGNDDEQIAQSVPRTGLIIRIQANAFSEHAVEFDGLMFDVSGVQVNDYVPMAGALVERNSLTFLQPDGVPDWAKPELIDGPVLRYDDGDTKVSDSLRLVGDKLVRQISVVTDEIYLERIVLVYARVS